MVITLRRYITGWLFAALLHGLCLVAVRAQTSEPCTPPAPPTITSDRTEICRGESAVLSATGCSGVVIWSTGETGSQIRVQPQQTKRYTALCRNDKGCLSCFADVVNIRVNTPLPPVVTPSASPVCVGSEVTLTASRCEGTVTWPNGSTGNTLSLRVDQTTTFGGAICTQKGCPSVGSVPVEIAVGVPQKPNVMASQPAICVGQSVTLSATNCLGIVRWNDGGMGITRTVTPMQTTAYHAVCEMGACHSEASETVNVTVKAANLKPMVATNILTNSCPFQTADLTRAIPADNSQNLPGQWLFKTQATINSPDVQSPMAVESGNYYLFLRTNDGCYSEPVKLTAQVTPCANGIAPCLSNPARIIAWTDSLDGQRGSVVLKSQLRGSARNPAWSTTGAGLLIKPGGTTTRYLFSEADQQQGTVTFTVLTQDPDGSGPCAGASASMSVAVPTSNGSAGQEIVGLSKKVFEPIWHPNGHVELAYQLAVTNMGKHELENIRLIDDLEQAFTAAGATIQSVSVSASGALATDPAYTGLPPHTNVLLPSQKLIAGARASVTLLVRLNVAGATTLTFSNQAQVQGLDANGTVCRDLSTSGDDPDPDHNGNPADNDEPTAITLQSVSPEGDVFIPEGFSPNGDGINDLFVVQRLPAGVTAGLQVFNRWGSVVYASDNYRNDWKGDANQGVTSDSKAQGLPNGTYFYVIKLSNGREFCRFITLNR